jgi:hypothetical protein
MVLCVLNYNHSAGLVVMGLLLMGYCSTADRSGSGADGATQCGRLRRRDHEPSAARPPHRYAPGTGPVRTISTVPSTPLSSATPLVQCRTALLAPTEQTLYSDLQTEPICGSGLVWERAGPFLGFQGIRALRADVLAKDKCLAQVSHVASRFRPCAALRAVCAALRALRALRCAPSALRCAALRCVLQVGSGPRLREHARAGSRGPHIPRKCGGCPPTATQPCALAQYLAVPRSTARQLTRRCGRSWRRRS